MQFSHRVNIDGTEFLFNDYSFDYFQSFFKQVVAHYKSDDEKYAAILTQIQQFLSNASTENRVHMVQVEQLIHHLHAQYQWAFCTPLLNKRNRFHRLPSSGILGGVCSGISKHYKISINMVRLIVVLCAIVFPPTIIAYLILWMVSPVSDEEFYDGSKKVLDAVHSEVKSIFEFLLELVVKLIGITFFLVGAGGLIAFIAGWHHLESSLGFPIEKLQLFIGGNQSLVFTSAILLVIIPLISILLQGIRILFHKASIPKYTFGTLGIIWGVSLFFCTYYGLRLQSEFDEFGSHETNQVFTIPTKTVLNLNQSSEGKELGLFRPELIFIPKNSEGLLDVQILTDSYGKTRRDAKKHAESIIYPIVFKNDSLILNQKFNLDGKLYRGQTVQIKFYVPINKTLILDNYNYKNVTLKHLDVTRRTHRRLRSRNTVSIKSTPYGFELIND